MSNTRKLKHRRTRFVCSRFARHEVGVKTDDHGNPYPVCIECGAPVRTKRPVR